MHFDQYWFHEMSERFFWRLCSPGFNDLKTWVLWTDPNHQQPVWFKSDPHKLGVFNSPPCRNVRNMLSPHRLVVLWFSCVMANADDEACALQRALSNAKIHDNYVCFDKWWYTHVQSVQFDETSHSISDGQPYIHDALPWHPNNHQVWIWVMEQQKWHNISMLA